MAEFDVAIVGGGINGCGIARDAAGRGLSVLLLEQGDLASGTSSASSKLIHGGLRYLEHYSFRLVRESLHERELLLKNAPHLVHPMRFVVPHVASQRPAWMVRIGVKLYDFLAGRSVLPRSRVLDLADDPAGVPLRTGGVGFEYSDCVTDDARLVIANAIGAREKGAQIRTRTRLQSARRVGERWELVATSGGNRETFTARALVNAAGPWAERVTETIVKSAAQVKTRLVKGSHIVYPRLYAHDRAYLLQNPDGRVVFVIPFGQNYSLIGTTDVDYAGDPGAVTASAEEIRYLCKTVESFFRTTVEPARVVWTYAGVRPLIDDDAGKAAKASREYQVVTDGGYGEAPMLSLIGGKLTAYRAMSEDVVDKLGYWLASRNAWTANEFLPGGDLGGKSFEEFVSALVAQYPQLPPPLLRRLAGAYGARAALVLGDARSEADLGARLIGDLYARELDYLRREEWAVTADDVLWRRTKLGVGASAEEIRNVEAAFAA